MRNPLQWLLLGLESSIKVETEDQDKTIWEGSDRAEVSIAGDSMTTIGNVIQVVGFLVAAFGGLWMVYVAFQENAMWGLGCLFLPFVGIIFAIMNWEEAKKPFLIELGGGAAMFLGSLLSGDRIFG